MATLYPAKSINIDDEYGKIEPKYFADIIFLDEELEIKMVIANGNEIIE